MSAFSTPSKICAIGGTYYDVAGTAIPAAPVTSPTLVTPDIGVATATSINGMPLTAESTVYTVACRDTSGNSAVNALVRGVTSTATAASTTTLTVTSTQVQIFTGSTTQTVVLPAATTLRIGHYYRVINKSSGVITVNANGGGLVGTVSANSGANVVVTSISTAAGTWVIDAGGGGDTSLGATQAFTGVNTFSNATAATSSTTGAVVVTGGLGITGDIVTSSTSAVSIGSNATAAASTILDLTSTTRGFRTPQMTTTQRDAIIGPATALQVFDSTTNSPQIYSSNTYQYMGTYLITNIALTSNVVTVTATNSFSTNDVGYIYDLLNASFSVLNGKQFTVTSANGSSFTYAYTNGNIASEAVSRGFALFTTSYTAGPVWSSITRTPMTMIYRDSMSMTNTQQWTGSGALSTAAGLWITVATAANGSTLTWTSPMSVSTGMYYLNLIHHKNTNNGFITIAVSCAGGAYQTVVHRLDGYSATSNYFSVNVWFTVTTAGTLAIRWTADGKNARSTDYYVLVGAPWILYKL